MIVTALAALLLWSILRFALWLSLGEGQVGVGVGAAALLYGLAFDLATMAYLAAPGLLLAAL